MFTSTLTVLVVFSCPTERHQHKKWQNVHGW